MTGVGLIHFAYRNAKIQGRQVGFQMPDEAFHEVGASMEPVSSTPQVKEAQPRPKVKQKAQQETNKKPGKMKKLFNMFWE